MSFLDSARSAHLLALYFLSLIHIFYSSDNGEKGVKRKKAGPPA